MWAAIAGHSPLKEMVEVRLNGVVVIMPCLHEWAGWVCWFDSIMVCFFFHHTHQPISTGYIFACWWLIPCHGFKNFHQNLQPLHTVLEAGYKTPVLRWGTCRVFKLRFGSFEEWLLAWVGVTKANSSIWRTTASFLFVQRQRQRYGSRDSMRKVK